MVSKAVNMNYTWRMCENSLDRDQCMEDIMTKGKIAEPFFFFQATQQLLTGEHLNKEWWKTNKNIYLKF